MLDLCHWENKEPERDDIELCRRTQVSVANFNRVKST